MSRRDFNNPEHWGFSLDPQGDGMTFKSDNQDWLTTTPNANHTGWWFMSNGKPIIEIRGPSFYSCLNVLKHDTGYRHELNRRRFKAGLPIIWS